MTWAFAGMPSGHAQSQRARPAEWPKDQGDSEHERLSCRLQHRNFAHSLSLSLSLSTQGRCRLGRQWQCRRLQDRATLRSVRRAADLQILRKSGRGQH